MTPDTAPIDPSKIELLKRGVTPAGTAHGDLARSLRQTVQPIEVAIPCASPVTSPTGTMFLPGLTDQANLTSPADMVHRPSAKMPPTLYARAISGEDLNAAMKALRPFVHSQSPAAHVDFLRVWTIAYERAPGYTGPQSVNNLMRMVGNVERVEALGTIGAFDRVAFFARLDALVSQGKRSQALRHIYTELDRLLLAGDESEVRRVLSCVNIGLYDFVVLVGFLTVTLPWMSALPERAGLLDRVRLRAHRELPPERVRDILAGLD